MSETEVNKYINYAFDYEEALYCQVPFHGKSGKALKCKAKKTCIFSILSANYSMCHNICSHFHNFLLKCN